MVGCNKYCHQNHPKLNSNQYHFQSSSNLHHNASLGDSHGSINKKTFQTDEPSSIPQTSQPNDDL